MILQTKTSSLYSELLATVLEKDLLKKTPQFYIWMFAGISIVSLAAWAGVIWLSLALTGPWELLALPLIVIQGALTAQYAFIGHELAHNQVFKSHKLNTALGLVVANLLAGLSYGFWLSKHNRHHGKPNMIDSDPDIDLRVIAFTTEQKYSKNSTERLLTRNQGWLFPILLFFTAFDLLLDSVKSVMRSTGRGANMRWLEALMLLVRFVTPIVVFSLFMELWMIPIAWMVYMLSFGFFMGTTFAVNHIGMPLVERDSRIGYLERQVLTSRNISPSWFKDSLMGGLNYQIEHHLFPSMSRPNLAKARVLVKAFCEAKGIDYKEQGLFHGFSEVIVYMNKVGISTKIDPFVCPIVAQYRQGV